MTWIGQTINLYVFLLTFLTSVTNTLQTESIYISFLLIINRNFFWTFAFVSNRHVPFCASYLQTKPNFQNPEYKSEAMDAVCILGVSRYTGIDDNRDIQSNNYRYRVNLVCNDIPVLAITTIF